jgi:hypothetical protein
LPSLRSALRDLAPVVPEPESRLGMVTGYSSVTSWVFARMLLDSPGETWVDSRSVTGYESRKGEQ